MSQVPGKRLYLIKEAEGTFKAGKVEGLGRTWHENGQMRCQAIAKRGITVKEDCWDENGVADK